MAMPVYECTCQKNCYTFVSVYVILLVKLRGAQRSTFRFQLTTRDTDLSISGRPLLLLHVLLPHPPLVSSSLLCSDPQKMHAALCALAHSLPSPRSLCS